MAAKWGLISFRLREFCILFWARCISICWNCTLEQRGNWRKCIRTYVQVNMLGSYVQTIPVQFNMRVKIYIGRV